MPGSATWRTEGLEADLAEEANDRGGRLPADDPERYAAELRASADQQYSIVNGGAGRVTFPYGTRRDGYLWNVFPLQVSAPNADPATAQPLDAVPPFVTVAPLPSVGITEQTSLPTPAPGPVQKGSPTPSPVSTGTPLP